MPEAIMEIRTSYTLTSEGNVGSRVEITGRARGRAATPQLLVRNRRFLAITPKQKGALRAFYPEGQYKLLIWAADLTAAASILGPAVLANALAADAHVRDLRLSFAGEFAIRTIGPGRAQMELTLGILTLSSAPHPQRGLWQCELAYDHAPAEESDIFIVERQERADFRDPPALLAAWRALRAQVREQRLARLREIVSELPRPGTPPWSI